MVLQRQHVHDNTIQRRTRDNHSRGSITQRRQIKAFNPGKGDAQRRFSANAQPTWACGRAGMRAGQLTASWPSSQADGRGSCLPLHRKTRVSMDWFSLLQSPSIPWCRSHAHTVLSALTCNGQLGHKLQREEGAAAGTLLLRAHAVAEGVLPAVVAPCATPWQADQSCSHPSSAVEERQPSSQAYRSGSFPPVRLARRSEQGRCRLEWPWRSRSTGRSNMSTTRCSKAVSKEGTASART